MPIDTQDRTIHTLLPCCTTANTETEPTAARFNRPPSLFSSDGFLRAIPSHNTRANHTNTENDNAATTEEDRETNFWKKKGMNVFLDWLLDPINNERLKNPKPIAGHKIGDLHKEIAKYVNDCCGTDWKPQQVKTKIQYAKDKYIKARDIPRKTGGGDTDDQTLKDRVLSECPEFDRFHAVYVGSVVLNPPPPKHSIVLSDDELHNSTDSDPETSDFDEDINGSMLDDEDLIPCMASMIENEQENTPGPSQAQATRTSKPPPTKRRKGNRNELFDAHDASILDSLKELKETAEMNQLSSSNFREAMKDLRRKEQAMEERERKWTETSTRRMLEQERELQTLLAQRRQTLETEMAEMKAELKQEKTELKQEKAELKQERADFKKEQELFKKEKEEYFVWREELVREVAATKKELGIRGVVRISSSRPKKITVY
ncbi:hypothetical protein BGZ79_008728 [Entomortierella chlamydospora]|nr:hypothetical protein BGZ79_008728 [Entomortierella chlamydospora]